MVLVERILLFAFLFLISVGELFSQNQSNLYDLRLCDKSCSSGNYTIESVYLSDVNGDPITSSLLTCTPGEEQTTYISFSYMTSSGSDVSNGRLFADLTVGDSTQFLNYYFGTIPSAKTVSDTLTLAAFPLAWVCGEEVILGNPLLAWTTSGSADLSESYDCGSYPTAQCQIQAEIVVSAPLAVQFDYTYDCPADGTSTVYFNSTTNGGKEAYIYQWTFTNSETGTSSISNPIVAFNGPGTAQLTITDANETQSTYTQSVSVPVETDISATITDHVDDENPDGAISIQVNSTGTYTFSWSGPGDFTSNQKDISQLSAGMYVLTVTDEFGCTSIWSYEVNYFGALPIVWKNAEAIYHSKDQKVVLNWSTYKEMESSHFEIQRALQNVNLFEKIGTVKSVGWSMQATTYQFVDNFLPEGITQIYYRIKQVDFDNTSDLSEVFLVKINPVERSKAQDWMVYPNPLEKRQLYLRYQGKPDLTGKKIRIRLFCPQLIKNIEFIWNSHEIDLQDFVKDLPKGMVLLEIHYNEKTQWIKLLQK